MPSGRLLLPCAALLLAVAAVAQPGTSPSVVGVTKSSVNPKLATIGSTTLTVEELLARLVPNGAPRPTLAPVPSGSSSARAQVERVADELRLELEAKQRGMTDGEPARLRERNVGYETLDAALERDAERAVEADARWLETERAVTAELTQPAAMHVFRVLAHDAKTAAEVIADAQGPEGFRKWYYHAYWRSADDATKLRSGELGMVRDDGSTDVPSVEVDPAVVAAAKALADGEVTKQPVMERGKFAVVWRRASRPAKQPSADEVRSVTRVRLIRLRYAERRARLLTSLRAQVTRPLDAQAEDELLAQIPVLAAVALNPPPRASATAPDAKPWPSETPTGLR